MINPKSRLPYVYTWLATAAFVAALSPLLEKYRRELGPALFRLLDA